MYGMGLDVWDGFLEGKGHGALGWGEGRLVWFITCQAGRGAAGICFKRGLGGTGVLAPKGFGSRSVRGTLRTGVLGALVRLFLSCIIWRSTQEDLMNVVQYRCLISAILHCQIILSLAFQIGIKQRVGAHGGLNTCINWIRDWQPYNTLILP